MITSRTPEGWRAWFSGEEENVVFHRNREESMRLLKEKYEKPVNTGVLDQSGTQN